MKSYDNDFISMQPPPLCFMSTFFPEPHAAQHSEFLHDANGHPTPSIRGIAGIAYENLKTIAYKA